MNRLIKLVLKERKLIIIFFALFIFLGMWVLFKTPVDAIPDLSENQVIVMTSWPGQTPQNVEDQVTYPLASQLAGLVGVKDVRASSIIGLSLITVIFEDDIDVYFARDRVSERLSAAKNLLPRDVNPVIGPDATSLGQIYMYTIEGEGLDNYEKRSLQDFNISYALQAVPGVAEVAPIGGYVKQYQVDLDPILMNSFGISVNEVAHHIRAANQNVSGRVIGMDDHEITIQGLGFLESVEDIENIVLKNRENNNPLVISDIATVSIGPAFRRSILANDEEEKVGGVVIMRYGENPLEVIDAVKEKIKDVEKSLPAGVKLEAFYDRTELIKSSIHTLRKALIEEILIVTLIVGLFLWHIKSTLVVVLAIPIGVLMAFVFMYLFGIPSNIMSLGGIAIGIGVMTDAAIVITENVYRKLAISGDSSPHGRLKTTYQATKEVIKPIFFSILIIILAFVPVFLLEGMEGKLFHPLAFTKTFSMVGALITSIFLVPILCYMFLDAKVKKETENPVVIYLQKFYEPILKWSLVKKKEVIAISVVLLGVAMSLALFIGSEFMPPLNEGSIMYMPITVPEVSEERAKELLIETNQIIGKFPEVESVVGKAGRAISATDPAPLSMIETIITLKDKNEWRKGMTKEALVREMNKAISIDKLWNGFTQPIIGRIEMLSTGIRSEVGIKVFGDDAVKLEELALEIEKIVMKVPGASDVSMLRTMGVPYTNIEMDEDKLRAHSVKRQDVLEAIDIGIGGKDISYSIQGRERYPIQLRLKEKFRDSPEEIENITVKSLMGHEMTLKQVANIKTEVGPSVLHSENGILRGVVQLNVSGRDLVGFVKEAQKVVEGELKLPNGYFIEWDGQYKKQVSAKNRMVIIVPIVFLIILLFLYLTYKDLSLALMVLLSIPFSLVGGFIALFFTGMNFSVAVWVGFIALFGIAVETAVVMVVYLENAYIKRKHSDGYIEEEDLKEAIYEGATLRLRPKLMTAGTSILGLAPMVITSGVGAEVTKPMAIVVMGGLISSTFIILVLLPVIFKIVKQKQNERIKLLISKS